VEDGGEEVEDEGEEVEDGEHLQKKTFQAV